MAALSSFSSSSLVVGCLIPSDGAGEGPLVGAALVPRGRKFASLLPTPPSRSAVQTESSHCVPSSNLLMSSLSRIAFRACSTLFCFTYLRTGFQSACCRSSYNSDTALSLFPEKYDSAVCDQTLFNQTLTLRNLLAVSRSTPGMKSTICWIWSSLGSTAIVASFCDMGLVVGWRGCGSACQSFGNQLISSD